LPSHRGKQEKRKREEKDKQLYPFSMPLQSIKLLLGRRLFRRKCKIQSTSLEDIGIQSGKVGFASHPDF
jgi:hypothetical protein